jgi:hypothetical protein
MWKGTVRLTAAAFPIKLVVSKSENKINILTTNISIILNTVDPWYLLVSVPRRLCWRKNHTCPAHSVVLQMLDLLFSITPLTFHQRHAGFRQISYFRLITAVKHIHIDLAFWASFAVWRNMFTKLRAGKHSADHTTTKTQMIKTGWLSASSSTELCHACACKLKIFVFEICLDLFIHLFLTMLGQCHMW